MNLIISHINCDFDGFSSMIAASLIYPEAKIVNVGAMEKSVRKFYKDYKNRFPIISEKSIVLEEIEKVIIVDNKNLARAGKIGKWILEERPDIPIICYDHHGDESPNFNFTYLHETKNGACITSLMEIINHNGIRISPFYATVFALGIYADTGSFTYKNVTPNDFRAVALLFDEGAKISMINKYLDSKLSHSQIKLMNKMINKIEFENVHGIDVHFLVFQDKTDDHDIAFLIQQLKKSEGIDILFSIIKQHDSSYIIARNNLEYVNLNTILQNFGGGGHKNAAAAKTKEMNSDKIKDKILLLLKNQISSYGVAEDIMSSPVYMISPETSIKEVQIHLTSKGFGQISVGVGKQLKGVVTKKEILKILHHKFVDRSVDLFMNPYNYIVEPHISVKKIHQMMVEKQLNFIYVGDQATQEVIGIITKHDVMKAQFYLTKGSINKNYFKFNNVETLMEKNLSPFNLDILKKAGHIAKKLNYKAYVVGGVARDIILNRFISDIDIIIDGDGINFAKHFTENFAKKAVFHSKFKTAVVTLSDGSKLDVVTARTEYYDKPGDLPVVEVTSLRHDLQRRDFTINTLVIELNPPDFGDLIDYYNGRRDIYNGKVEILHNLSFIEDPIRILRGIRFEQRYGFELEENTLHHLNRSIELQVLKKSSFSRIRDEFIAITKEEFPEKPFKRLEDFGALEQLYSQLSFQEKEYNLFIKFREIKHDCLVNTDEKVDDSLVYHLLLLSDLILRKKRKFISLFNYVNNLSTLVDQVDHFMSKAFIKLSQSETNYDIYEAYNKLDNETIIYLTCLYPKFLEKTKLYYSKIKDVKLHIKGHDLINLGFKQGKKIGTILKYILKMKLNGLIDKKDQEFIEAKRLLLKDLEE